MEIVSDSEEAANYHQILEFFEMCANLITTLARWSACTAELMAICRCRRRHVIAFCCSLFPTGSMNASCTPWFWQWSANVSMQRPQPVDWRCSAPYLASLLTIDPQNHSLKCYPSNIFKRRKTTMFVRILYRLYHMMPSIEAMQECIYSTRLTCHMTMSREAGDFWLLLKVQGNYSSFKIHTYNDCFCCKVYINCVHVVNFQWDADFRKHTIIVAICCTKTSGKRLHSVMCNFSAVNKLYNV